jgi:hypothetical protein
VEAWKRLRKQRQSESDEPRAKAQKKDRGREQDGPEMET